MRFKLIYTLQMIVFQFSSYFSLWALLDYNEWIQYAVLLYQKSTSLYLCDQRVWQWNEERKKNNWREKYIAFPAKWAVRLVIALTSGLCLSLSTRTVKVQSPPCLLNKYYDLILTMTKSCWPTQSIAKCLKIISRHNKHKMANSATLVESCL